MSTEVEAMKTITIEIPGDTFAILKRSPKELGQEMCLAAAKLWYTQGRISPEKAAEFAGITRVALIDALAAAKLPAHHVDLDELIEEVEIAGESGRICLDPASLFCERSANYYQCRI